MRSQPWEPPNGQIAYQIDWARRLQAEALAWFGLATPERPYRTVGAGMRWRLRSYGAAERQPSVLVVSAPIKRFYIWDLAPGASAVAQCLNAGFGVDLLEWLPPSDDDRGGLADYAGDAIAEAVACSTHAARRTAPFLIGHSLGGTFAAIFAAAQPARIRGLVLLSSPLCFAPNSSRFRDALVAIAPTVVPRGTVPGSFLSQLSAIASPQTFVWSRIADAALSIGDAGLLELQARIERWTLDELPMSGPLVGEVLQLLYREDRFCRGILRVGNSEVGPSTLTAPLLALVNSADEVVPEAAVRPFLERMPKRMARFLEYPGEAGIGLQHLAFLVGRTAHAAAWPRIIAWIREHG